MEGQVCRHGCVAAAATEGFGDREQPPKADVRGPFTHEPRDDDPKLNAIQAYIAKNQRHGFDKLYPVVRRQGFGKHRLYRIYKALGMNLKRKGKRRLPARIKTPLVQTPGCLRAGTGSLRHEHYPNQPSSTGTIRIATSKMSWSVCRPSPQAASSNCCRSAGCHCKRLTDPIIIISLARELPTLYA